MPAPKNDSTGNPLFVIGWQTAWAPAGQIAQALIHTDIAERYGLKLDFQGFLFGPEMNEAALNDQINTLNTGSVPAITLMSMSKDWQIVGRLTRQPLSLITRSTGDVKSIDQLKGKSIGVPFGSGPHPYLLAFLKSHHLQIGDSAQAVKLVNVSPSEQIIALKQNSVDAIATWEPQTCLALTKKYGVLLFEEADVGFIIVSKHLCRLSPKSVSDLLNAYADANYFVASHRNQTNQWFSQVSRMDQTVLDRLKNIEPNLLAKDRLDVSLDISQNEVDSIQKVANTMFENGLIKRRLTIADCIDLSYWRKAKSTRQNRLAARTAVKVIQP